MPGFMNICGFMPVSAICRPVEDKPHTIVADAEIVIDETFEDNIRTLNGLLYYYVPYDFGPPKDGLYFVRGKFCCMGGKIVVGDGRNVNEYDLLIDADSVSI
jgi:hypothetical protein